MKEEKMSGIIENTKAVVTKQPSLVLSGVVSRMTSHDMEVFLCGWGAAFVNIGITFPINKIMFRQQLHGVTARKAINQLQKEGFRHLYRGLLSPLLQKTTSLSLMFGSYYKIQNTLSENYPSLWLPANRSISALIAGTLEACLCPFERIQVLMQDRQYQSHFYNTAHAFKEVRRYGCREYYRGLTAILMRNGPSNIPFFLVRDYLMETLPKADSHAFQISQDFVSGAVLGAVLSTIFYPVNVVKVQMQCKFGGEFDGFMKTFTQVWIERDRKLKKLFRGAQINFIRSFISWGVINATYELLMRHVFGRSSRLADSMS